MPVAATWAACFSTPSRPWTPHHPPAPSQRFDLPGQGLDLLHEAGGEDARLAGLPLLVGQPLMGQGERDVVRDAAREVGVLGAVRVGSFGEEEETAHELPQGVHRHRHQ